ncbi:unnamed protein product [Symbiodinium natans]|uniref:Uncharacterized protein n=1 Tax=Symbiodinium natans TaxID=878477 RepID=A0A812STT3_9DINO|nr:unnamed protein product [Symbiodinium natans]
MLKLTCRSARQPASGHGMSEERSMPAVPRPLPTLAGKMDVLVAGGHDYERLIFMMHAQRLGVADAVEATEICDFKMALRNSQKYSQDLPFVVFLGSEWLHHLEGLDLDERPPVFVNFSCVSPSRPDAYDYHILTSSLPEQVSQLLCRVLDVWGTAGDSQQEHPAEKQGSNAPYRCLTRLQTFS